MRPRTFVARVPPRGDTGRALRRDRTRIVRRLRSAICCAALIWAAPSLATVNFGEYLEIPGVGYDADGAGVAAGDIDSNGVTDLVFMAYDDPSGPNQFRFRVAWNVYEDADGKFHASEWTPQQSADTPYFATDGVGDDADGAGVALGDINNDGKLDMVLMAYDVQHAVPSEPLDLNSFRYKVCFGMQSEGPKKGYYTTSVMTSMTGTKVSGISNSAYGAGVALADIDGNKQLDMVLMDYTGWEFHYKIGWNLKPSDGTATTWGSPVTILAQNVTGEGADLCVADVDHNGTLDMILLAYDAPDGPNSFRYVIAWNLGKDGQPQSVSRQFSVPGVGDSGQGAGVAVFDKFGAGSAWSFLPPEEGRPRLLLMAYDNPEEENSFKYRVLPLTTSGRTFGVADHWDFKKPQGIPGAWVGTTPAGLTGPNLMQLSDPFVSATAWDAVNEFLDFSQYCLATKPDPICFYDYPSNKQTFLDVDNRVGHREYFPDLYVAAVSWYVDNYMRWTPDKLNEYVLNSLWDLNYHPPVGGDFPVPANYTIRYTDYNLLSADAKKKLDKEYPADPPYSTDPYLFHGDCEDHAILRMALLRALGFDPNYVWCVDEPGHEFTMVLYKTAFRFVGYAPIYEYLGAPGSEAYCGVWNEIHGDYTNDLPWWTPEVENYPDYVFGRSWQFSDGCTSDTLRK